MPPQPPKPQLPKTEPEMLVALDPATAIAVCLAEIEISKAQLRIALAQLPASSQPLAPLRDLSPLGR